MFGRVKPSNAEACYHAFHSAANVQVGEVSCLNQAVYMDREWIVPGWIRRNIYLCRR